MKTLKLFSFLIFFISLTSFSFAQEAKTETFKVAGNCEMCKTRIEKAAKVAGAESADWNTETKMLTVKFNSSSTDAAKIQQAIATVGHDTPDFKTSDDVYNKLPGCCKYERMSSTSMNCCDSEKCRKGDTHSEHKGNHSMMMNGKTKKAS